MKIKNTFLLTLFLAVALFAAACTPVESPPVQEPLSGPADTPIPTETPTAEPTEPPTEEPTGPYTEAWLSGLSPDTILLQQDYEPTFFRPESFYPFGRFPSFTLYADGTLVYVNAGATVDEQQIELVHLTPAETIATLEQVMELGFEKLESHLDMCGNVAGEEDEVCIADASITVLRGAVPGGEFREVKIYANFSDDPEALNAVLEFYNSYTNPEAEPYVPTHATVFAHKLQYELEVPVRTWPLDIEMLRNLDPHEYDLDAFILQSEDLATFLAEFPVSVNSYFFDLEGATVEVYIVPWLPYADHTEAIETAFP